MAGRKVRQRIKKVKTVKKKKCFKNKCWGIQQKTRKIIKRKDEKNIQKEKKMVGTGNLSLTLRRIQISTLYYFEQFDFF